MVEKNDALELSFLFRDFIKKDSNIKAMESQIQHILNNPHYYVPVACFKERVVGTAMAILCYDLVGECNNFMLVENVVVDPEYQRQGIGRLLMESIEEFGLRNKCKYIILVSEMERDGSHRFYESLGYTTNQQGFKKVLYTTS